MAVVIKPGGSMVALKPLPNWVAEPVRDVVIGAVAGAIVGASTHVLCNAVLPVSFLHQEYLELLRRPILELASKSAVSFGAMSGITRVMMKLRGKDYVDFPTSLVAGFGYGVTSSLITGCPEVISHGVLYALNTGAWFKLYEREKSKRLKGKSIAFAKRYHFTPTQRSSSSLVLPEETRNSPAFLADEGEFVATLKRLQSWLAKPIEETVTSAVVGAIGGVCLKTFFLDTGSLDAKLFSSWGGYQPLIQSLMLGSILEEGRNFALVLGVPAAITSVMDKLTGKGDVAQKCMVGGFGAGVTLSLVTGVRWPEAISVGVIYALASGGLCMALEALHKKLSDHIHDDKTKDKLGPAGIDATNFNTGFFTTNALSLQLADDHRNEVKKGGKRTWFY